MDKTENISRRDALKRIGAAMASAAMASSGLLALSSCEKRTKRVILYFTGTGNCLYVARQLAGTDGLTLSIPQLMKKREFEIEADEIGIVYPVYGHMPPFMVRQFIKQARLKAGYKFAILTYGARKCDAVEIWDDIARSAGVSFDYINTLIMVDNWLPNFDMNEQIKIDKHIPENMERISADIARHRQWHEPVTEEERQQHRGFLAFSGLDPEVGFLMKSEEYFTVTDACIGCGACVELCPRGNYRLSSQGVKMQGDCEFCFACIQNCPQKAIQFAKNGDNPLLRNGEKNPNARYRNENVSLMDIKRANNQF
ncbi:MAG: EFR1 family ferrodoxin [Muribaculaceae bacterium]